MTSSPDPHRPGTPDGMTEADLEQRAELASFLGKEIWPASGADLQSRAREQHAPDSVVRRLAAAPADQTFANIQELWSALTGQQEAHRF
jgi:hypothetical protein